MNKFKHELGLIAKDKITGFKGMITARIEYLTGCNRYCLQPTELDGYKIPESNYFDEGQIEIVSDGIKPNDVQSKEKGACSPPPKNKHNSI